MLDEMSRIYSETRTPIENLYTDLERLNELWETGLMEQETYFRAIEMYGEEYASHFDDMKSHAERTQNAMGEGWQGLVGDMENAFDGWASSYSRELNDMLWDSELAFDRILESFGRMVTQMMIQSAMADVTGALFGSDDSGGLVGGAVNWVGGLFHSGGIVGDGGASVSAPAAVWAGAPRLHNGLAPDEFPAILQRGEGVFTRDQMQAIGQAPNVQVNVIDNTSEKKDVSQEQLKFDGEKWILNVVLDSANRNKRGFAKGMRAALGKV
jgi:hypothetical protein